MGVLDVSGLLGGFGCVWGAAPDGGAGLHGGGAMADVKVKVKIRKLEKIETTGQRAERVG